MTESLSQSVAEQYLRYSYPAPISDLKAAIANGYFDLNSPLFSLYDYWPSETPREEQLRILVAGCGTNQAAYIALTSPRSSVTGIDLSESSIAHTNFLKSKHDLKNLNVLRLNILDIANLDQEFDLIISTGVIHHMESPLNGLLKLKSVLAKNGVISLMVYGKTLRVGVYMLQEAFRYLGAGQQEKSDVDLVKRVLSILPSDHAVRRYEKHAPDLKYDAGIVDSFLHPQDTAYTVNDIFHLTDKAGLTFWDWSDRLPYSASATLQYDQELFARLKRVKVVDRWHVVDLLSQRLGTHRFMLVHPERLNRISHINFTNDDWLSWIPSWKIGLYAPIPSERRMYARAGHSFSISPNIIPIMSLIDGKKSIKQIIQDYFDLFGRTSQKEIRSFFAQMWEWSHLCYRR